MASSTGGHGDRGFPSFDRQIPRGPCDLELWTPKNLEVLGGRTLRTTPLKVWVSAASIPEFLKLGSTLTAAGLAAASHSTLIAILLGIAAAFQLYSSSRNLRLVLALSSDLHCLACAFPDGACREAQSHPFTVATNNLLHLELVTARHLDIVVNEVLREWRVEEIVTVASS